MSRYKHCSKGCQVLACLTSTVLSLDLSSWCLVLAWMSVLQRHFPWPSSLKKPPPTPPNHSVFSSSQSLFQLLLPIKSTFPLWLPECRENTAGFVHDQDSGAHHVVGTQKSLCWTNEFVQASFANCLLRGGLPSPNPSPLVPINHQNCCSCYNRLFHLESQRVLPLYLKP